MTNHLATILARTPAVPNAAGGTAYAIDDLARLDRFLVLGSEGGSYDATETTLARECAPALLRAIAAGGPRAVARIVAISRSGRAPRNDPALFALALAAAAEDLATRRAALDALHSVARAGAHLFQFAAYAQASRGWGRSTPARPCRVRCRRPGGDRRLCDRRLKMRRPDAYELRARALATEAGLDPDGRVERPGQRSMPVWCTFREAARAEYLARAAAAVELPPDRRATSSSRHGRARAMRDPAIRATTVGAKTVGARGRLVVCASVRARAYDGQPLERLLSWDGTKLEHAAA